MAWLQQRTWQDEMRDNLAHQVHTLRRELAAFGGTAGRYGSHLQHDAGEVGEALVRGGAAVAHQIGRQAKRAGRAVRNDPAPAIAAVIMAGCLLSLVLSRR